MIVLFLGVWIINFFLNFIGKDQDKNTAFTLYILRTIVYLLFTSIIVHLFSFVVVSMAINLFVLFFSLYIQITLYPYDRIHQFLNLKKPINVSYLIKGNISEKVLRESTYAMIKGIPEVLKKPAIKAEITILEDESLKLDIAIWSKYRDQVATYVALFNGILDIAHKEDYSISLYDLKNKISFKSIEDQVALTYLVQGTVSPEELTELVHTAINELPEILEQPPLLIEVTNTDKENLKLHICAWHRSQDYGSLYGSISKKLFDLFYEKEYVFEETTFSKI